MASLPIPGSAIARYNQLNSPVGPLGALVRDLTAPWITGLVAKGMGLAAAPVLPPSRPRLRR